MGKDQSLDAEIVTLSERYRTTLEGTQRELDGVMARISELDEEKRDLEQRALQLQTKIEVLGSVCNDLKEDETKGWVELATSGGIQECCYRVLVERGEPLSALAIQEQLEFRGVKLDHYKNALAIIHTSMKRIPDRVRTFKQQLSARPGERSSSARFYEAIKQPALKKVAAAEEK